MEDFTFGTFSMMEHRHYHQNIFFLCTVYTVNQHKFYFNFFSFG